ncbi:hypothetical protein Pmani_019501 [Petrolisthes manimaculis]|uniref:Endonuclease/exonuclease/phosphatase domain-containing protein n=1 Tax=Petrolisthes manimaculis TaxID=1843537 RepID=A0AAE1U7L2_9EUCA|nr:hypothetical protein Pmani_019501 [Petrolisthes manimaculis]
MGGIKGTNLPRVNWVCNDCAEIFCETPTKNSDKIDELKAEMKELKEMVMKGFAEMRGEVKSVVKKSSDEVGVVVEEAVRERVTSAVTSERDKMVTEVKAELRSLPAKIADTKDIKLKKQYSEIVSNKPNTILAVIIKPKHDSCALDTEEITSVLKNIPVISMKTNKENLTKLILPTETARNKALEALEGSNTLTNTHDIQNEKRLKPKITIPYIPDIIEDSEIVQSILEKNPYITELIDQENEVKLLFTKPGSQNNDTKTAVLAISPQIRTPIKKNDDRVYLHFVRFCLTENFVSVLEKISVQVKMMGNPEPSVIINGDFNLPNANWHELSIYWGSLVDRLQANALFNMVDCPMLTGTS